MIRFIHVCMHVIFNYFFLKFTTGQGTNRNQYYRCDIANKTQPIGDFACYSHFYNFHLAGFQLGYSDFVGTKDIITLA
jgi:hypothetical protein